MARSRTLSTTTRDITQYEPEPVQEVNNNDVGGVNHEEEQVQNDGVAEDEALIQENLGNEQSNGVLADTETLLG